MQVAYKSLLQLKQSLIYVSCEEEADPNEPLPETFEEQVDAMLSLLQSKLEGPQVCVKFCEITFLSSLFAVSQFLQYDYGEFGKAEHQGYWLSCSETRFEETGRNSYFFRTGWTLVVSKFQSSITMFRKTHS